MSRVSVTDIITMPDNTARRTRKSLFLRQVAGALSGQELTDEQKKKLVSDIRKDKEAQSALRSIAGAMDMKQAAIKYCPVDGKRFSPDHDICPVHKVKLEELAD